MEDRKIPFFQRLKFAIFNLERYQDFALEKTKVAFKYFAKLILLFALIISIAITYEYVLMSKEVVKIIKEDLPEFSLSQNTLTSNAEGPTIIEKGNKNLNYSIIIDTNIDENSTEFEDYSKKLKYNNFGILFLKDKFYINAAMYNDLQGFTYDQIKSRYNFDVIDKASLIKMVDDINPLSAIIALYLTLSLYLFSSYFIATLLEILLLFVLGYFTAKIVKVNLKNNQIFSIAIYALTLPILLNAIYIPVNILAGFEIKYFQVMYTTISYIYLITAILLIRSEVIKQQIEVGKIEEVQKDVKKEIEERKEKENDKQKEDKKDENTRR